MTYLEAIGYRFFDIEIVETQSENHPYGDPDLPCPQEALQDFLNLSHEPGEECITKGEHMFIIWRDIEKPGTFYANAWGFSEPGEESQFTTYYEFKVHGEAR